MTERFATLRPWAALALGIAAFAAGLALARARLPEWRPGALPDRRLFVERHRELGARIGFRPAPGALSNPSETKVDNHFQNFPLACAPADSPAPDSTDVGTGICVAVSRPGRLPGDSKQRELLVYFSPEGVPRGVFWSLNKQSNFQTLSDEVIAPDALQRSLLGLLLAPGESLGPPRRGVLRAISTSVYPILGSSPAEHLFVYTHPGGSVSAARRPGGAAQAFAEVMHDSAGDVLIHAVLPVLFVFVAIILFLTQLGRGRIGLVNAAVLTIAGVSTELPALAVPGLTAGGFLLRLLWLLLQAGFFLLVWAVGESFLRSLRPDLVTGLDGLRTGRLGPREGRALLLGFAAGAALAGASLAVQAAAYALPGIWSGLPSLQLPLASLWHPPILDGLFLAGSTVLLLACALRLLPRYATPAAALAIALTAMPLDLHPYPLRIAVGFGLGLTLMALCRRLGVAGLLTAALTLHLLPLATFAALHPVWLPGTLGVSGGLCLVLLGAGITGLRQPTQTETVRLRPPAFMRRLEEERRLQYEMELLSRMQEGLLPESLPEVPGWQIAARSILASEAGGDLYDVKLDEAGGLWIAIGDVAGHGYSCAIVQAMTIAALASFIAQGRGPAEVLHSVDRVIRRGQTPRNFTSVSLLRIEPETGEAVFSNAGHPYPLLETVNEKGSAVAEIPLPGLPLGQGPDRLYREHRFTIPPGAALVLYTDGLIESCDARDVPYGFDRPREVLRQAGATASGASAGAILDTLLSDWRRHLSGEEPSDDTTVLVLTRKV